VTDLGQPSSRSVRTHQEFLRDHDLDGFLRRADAILSGEVPITRNARGQFVPKEVKKPKG
jgi:hypothetical protein